MARDLTSLTTAELLAVAAAAADRAAFAAVVAELVRRYRRLVYAQALAICGHDRGLADDVFQETFLRLLRWLAKNGRAPLHSLPRLLKVFSRRAAIDLLRKEGRPGPPAASAEFTDLDTALYVQQLLEGLDPRSAEVLRLTYMEDRSATEIAEKIGVTPGHVRTLRYRALEAIRARQEFDDLVDRLEPL